MEKRTTLSQDVLLMNAYCQLSSIQKDISSGIEKVTKSDIKSVLKERLCLRKEEMKRLKDGINEIVKNI